MEPKGYTTKADVENYLLTNINDSFNDQIDAWLMTVEAYIDHATSRDFSVTTGSATDRVYDGDGTDTLFVDPVSDVTAIKLSPTSEALGVTNYFLYPANNTLKTKIKLGYLCFPIGNQNIVVTGKFGYAAVPADIKFVATVLLAGIINQTTPTTGEIQSLSVGRYSVSYKTPQQLEDFSKVEQILQYNKRYRF